MKKTVLVIPLFIFHAYLNGQSTFNYLEELQKYWNYRYHLTGDKILPIQYMPWEAGSQECHK